MPPPLEKYWFIQVPKGGSAKRDQPGETDGLWLICAKQSLSHAQCYDFSLPADKITLTALLKADAFVLNWRDKYYAYQNSCPHTGVNLNWQPNQFFDFESRFVQCGIHGALFEPASGLCVRGPCLARSLAALPLIIHNENVFLDIARLAAD